ncbi:hypothetical protein BGZ65_006918 [Modicella reniformis]|uniref:Uncharacterized protein n=1 Tax=Modicella reniformis TaxID=1440133 RepID=A0A9P6IMX3_9FUNG|nr:hypothetical protein BGZ65_006918 [Modicella reniformis]
MDQMFGSDLPLEQEVCQQSLGKALLVLFQAKRAALRKAFANIEGENIVSSALRRFIVHVTAATDNNNQDELLLRMQEVYRPLLDKVTPTWK